MSAIKIPLMRSTFFQEKETKEALIDFIRSADRLSMHNECRRFEELFSAFQERKNSLFVANGSAANLALLQALINLGRLKRGDRVGISAVTWATNVMPILQLGLTPVAVDCSTKDLNAHSEHLQEVLPTLRAFFVTNVLGFAGDLDEIASVCEKAGVILLEDNCESLGTRYQGKLLGNFGLASTFSFFVGHHLSTIEGGMICTDDDELHEMCTMVRAHGWDRSLPPERQQELREQAGVDDFLGKYTFYHPGFNVRPTEINGFLGCVQLPLLQETIRARERHFRVLHATTLQRADLYEPLDVDHLEMISNFAMPLICKTVSIRSALVERCIKEGIEHRPVIAGNITLHPFWKSSLPLQDLPGATAIHERGCYLPNHPDLTDAEVQLLSHVILDV